MHIPAYLQEAISDLNKIEMMWHDHLLNVHFRMDVDMIWSFLASDFGRYCLKNCPVLSYTTYNSDIILLTNYNVTSILKFHAQ